MADINIQVSSQDGPRQIRLDCVIDREVGRTLRDPELDPGWSQPLDATVKAFARAVEAGCFGPTGSVTLSHASDGKKPSEFHSWVLHLPQMPASAFRILVNMLEASVPLGSGLLSARLAERDAQGGMIATVAGLGPLPLAAPPFPFRLPAAAEAKQLYIAVDLSRSQDPALQLVAGVLGAWSGLLAGGFPAQFPAPFCTGRLVDVSLDASTATASIEFLHASQESWQPLLRALWNVHETFPIREVSAQ
jgi:hypothetical protein